MTNGMVIRQLLQSLQQDDWRKSNPFSTDVQLANEVILHPFARDYEKLEALRLWLQANQPCLFGRIAAATHRMHLCVLSEDDLMSSDQHVRDKIKRERQLWKIGSLRNELPEHGFMLLIASPRVALAAPDQNLRRFAHHMRDLVWDQTERDEEGNDVTWETLYLRQPGGAYVRFRFSVDYFGAQGDGRWWHDHRVPGGIAFTANSVGHMAQTRDWYEGRGAQIEWIVKVAMETVELGADTSWGKAIWLEPLQEGRPQRGKVCPFVDVASIKASLKGKDWSYYAGYLSTDHSIRDEFFLRSSPERPKDITRRWLLDLLYLYDPKARDYEKFVVGEPVPEEDVYGELGTPDTWRVGPIMKVVSAAKKVHRKAIAPVAGALGRGVRRIIGSKHETSRDRIFAALAAMRKKWLPPNESQ